jgi:glycosyltransferase involved in cell wall biosynthesis
MLISVIIPTYKDIEALNLILKALQRQTYRDFEVIIAEDDSSSELETYLKENSFSFTLKHHSQEDNGWRKARALNRSIMLSEGEYLIFFDGDCIPFSTFVEAHHSLMQKKRILCGRRVNLGDGFSEKLRSQELDIQKIEDNFFGFWQKMKNDGARHIEQGLFLFPSSIFYKTIIKLLDKKKRLVGCNFSLFKEDILAINGFDESYPSGDIADDVDIEWRLNAVGVKNKSCKYAANLLHLNHSRPDRKEAHKHNYELMLEKQKENLIQCKLGIK